MSLGFSLGDIIVVSHCSRVSRVHRRPKPDTDHTATTSIKLGYVYFKNLKSANKILFDPSSKEFSEV